MSRGARMAALVVAGLMLGGGALLVWVANAGWPLVLMGLLIVAGTLFDRGYRARADAVGHGQWQRTGEREVDSATGTITEVWYDPLTGQRRYEPIGRAPN